VAWSLLFHPEGASLLGRIRRRSGSSLPAHLLVFVSLRHSQRWLHMPLLLAAGPGWSAPQVRTGLLCLVRSAAALSQRRESQRKNSSSCSAAEKPLSGDKTISEIMRPGQSPGVSLSCLFAALCQRLENRDALVQSSRSTPDLCSLIRGS